MSCQNITDYCRQSNLPQVSRGEFTTVPSTGTISRGIYTQCNCLHYLYTHECMEIEDTLNPFCCWTDIVQLLCIPYLSAELAQLHTTSHKKSLILHYIKHITYTRILRKTNVTPHTTYIQPWPCTMLQKFLLEERRQHKLVSWFLW